jgi:hypothetical protein
MRGVLPIAVDPVSLELPNWRRQSTFYKALSSNSLSLGYVKSFAASRLYFGNGKLLNSSGSSRDAPRELSDSCAKHDCQLETPRTWKALERLASAFYGV